MTVTCQLSGFYLMWHGFNPPVGFPCRQAFLISFVLLYLGWRCYAHWDGLSLRQVGIALALYGGLTLLAGRAEYGYLDTASLWKDLLLLALLAGLLAAALLFPKMEERGRSLLLLTALFLQSANLLLNGQDVLSQIPYYTQKDFTGYIDQVRPVVEWVKAEDRELLPPGKNLPAGSQRSHAAVLSGAVPFQLHRKDRHQKVPGAPGTAQQRQLGVLQQGLHHGGGQPAGGEIPAGQDPAPTPTMKSCMPKTG